MIHIEEKLTLITPCFCAGANQNVAELRAPAVRGQLRWWFRVLGGTPDQENELFGGVHGETKASKIVIRIKDAAPLNGEPTELPRPNAPLYYLFHFARVSGEKKRYESSGWLKEDTCFTVEALQRLPMTHEEEKQFLAAWNAFLNFGGLGLRQTRGIGSFSPQNLLNYNDIKQAAGQLAAHGIGTWYIGGMDRKPFFGKNWREALICLEAALGHVRQHGFKSDASTPMGNSRPRQASALHLRPVRLKEGYLSLLYFTPQILAPQNAYRQTELLELLDSNIPCKYPYRQKPDNPDRRNECRIIRL